MMLRLSLLLQICRLASSAAAPPRGTCPAPTVATSAPVFITDAHFASWTVDPSRNRAFFDVSWTDPRLLYLASEVGRGSVLRFGGGGGDALTYGVPVQCDSPVPAWGYECLNKSTLDALLGVASAASARLVFAIDILPLGGGSPPAPWNPDAASGVLEYIRDTGFPLFGVELGNERNANGFTAAEQAAAFRVLWRLLQTLWPAPLRPRLWGPDADGAGPPTDDPRRLANQAAFLADFVGNLSGGPPLAAVTFHEYIQITSASVLNGSALDASAHNARALVAAVRAVSPDVPVWGGEVGPHTGASTGNTTNTGSCDDNKLCGRFGSCIWYADAMGSSARAGVAGFARQDLVGAFYALLNTSRPGATGDAQGRFTPTPDYYLLWLWQRLVGPRVLDVAPPPGAQGVRAYAFCSANVTNAATLVLINIGAAPVCVGAPSFVPAGAALTVYALTAADAAGVEAWGARLNGRPLATGQGGALPDLRGEDVPAAGGVTLQPTSVALVVAPADAGALPACAGAGG